MFLAIFLLYVVVEVAVLIWVGSAIGVLWTVLLLVVSSVVGMALFASQSRKAFTKLGMASQGQGSPSKAIADSLIITVGGMLLFIPGLVTSALGLLALFPPTRGIIRPVLTLGALRKFGPLGKYTAAGAMGARGYRTFGGATVIDGEVLDSRIVVDEPGGAAPRPTPEKPAEYLIIEPADTPLSSKDENYRGKQAD